MNPFEQQFTRLSPSARQRFLRKRVERFAAHYQRAEDPRMNAYKTLSQQISALISVCRKALEGKPHLEFLFNGLCASRALTDIISCSPDPQFRKLFQDIFFDPNASVKAAEAQPAEAVNH